MGGAVDSVEESKAAHGDAFAVAGSLSAGGGSGQAPSEFSKITVSTFSELLPAEGSVVNFLLCPVALVSVAF